MYNELLNMDCNSEKVAEKAQIRKILLALSSYDLESC